jgi:hypothetical protein
MPYIFIQLQDYASNTFAIKHDKHRNNSKEILSQQYVKSVNKDK